MLGRRFEETGTLTLSTVDGCVRAVRRRRRADPVRRHSGDGRGPPPASVPRYVPDPLRRRPSRRRRGEHDPDRRTGRFQRRSRNLLAGVRGAAGRGRGRRMKIKVWGARGSIPAPGPETMRYGGNTSCVEVTLSDGSTVILDAGTGIRNLGAVAAPRRAADQHPAHPPPPRPHPGADVLRAGVSPGVGDRDLGSRLAGGPRCATASRATSRRRSHRSRSASCPRSSPSGRPTPSNGRSVPRGSGRRRSTTAAPRSATGSTTDPRPCVTSRITSPDSAPRCPNSPTTGSPGSNSLRAPRC